ncbi:hypothetical protein Y1Q_0012974 [Alligator mississippiensis]|uniref:Uncharacterized protein n=1 Tax=Alligator mississippiensis TaxID=8496 RepID=A0A151NWH6_ALLMI|nr:hypothetical protein Y1Q_0012974 [Alligator mississippiensis]
MLSIRPCFSCLQKRLGNNIFVFPLTLKETFALSDITLAEQMVNEETDEELHESLPGISRVNRQDQLHRKWLPQQKVPEIPAKLRP